MPVNYDDAGIDTFMTILATTLVRLGIVERKR